MQIEPGSGICRSILESMPAAMYVVDRERKIVLWNDWAEKISGYLRHEVIGRLCGDNILMHCNRHGTILCGVACPLQETMHDGHPRGAEVYMLHRAGYRVPVRVRATPLRDENGTIIGAVEVLEEGDLISVVAPRDSMEKLLAEQLTDFAARHIPFSVVCVKLENPAHFAEMYGRQAVEEAIEVVADTLSRCIQRTDHLGWWSENRLLAILPDCRPVAAAEIAGSLKELAAHSTFHWWGDRLSVPVAVGAATVGAEDTAASLLARCEEALHT